LPEIHYVAMVRASFCLSIVVLAAGHGDLVDPIPRNFNPVSHYYQERGELGCFGDACYWFQQSCCCGRNECDNGQDRDSCAASEMDKPASCPGQAPVVDPCGTYNPAVQPLFPMPEPRGSKLPERHAVQWVAGSLQPVRSAIWINHFGVYQYRLCRKDKTITENCFQQNVLAFADETDPLAWKSVGSETRADNNDTIIVPEATGSYVLQWRWDCLKTAQVWANCADVDIVTIPSPAPPPPAPTPSACKSAGFEFFADTYCSRYNHTKISVLNEEDCCDQCIKQGNCNAWTFESTGKLPYCYLAPSPNNESAADKTCGVRAPSLV